MAIRVGQFRPPPVKVSITDRQAQIQFDSPADLVDYLTRHPELAKRIHEFDWVVQEITGGR